MILFATPLVERADYLISGKAPADFDPSAYMPLLQTTVRWFLQVCTIIGIPMIFLGMAFPWILDDQHTPKRLGKIYALNTVFAVVGAPIEAELLRFTEMNISGAENGMRRPSSSTPTRSNRKSFDAESTGKNASR